jgi:hypothetical protein
LPYKNIYSFLAKVFAICPLNHYPLRTMKQKLWITLVTYLAYCIDKELYKAIDYLCDQVRVLVEQQEKQNKRILLTNSQRMRIEPKHNVDDNAEIQCIERLGGLLKSYHRLAA